MTSDKIIAGKQNPSAGQGEAQKSLGMLACVFVRCTAQPGLDLTSQFAFGQPPIAERLVVHEYPWRKHDAPALRQLEPLLRIELQNHDVQRVIRFEPRQDLFCLVAERAVLL